MKFAYVKLDYLGKIGVEKKQHAVDFRPLPLFTAKSDIQI
jgi:hypothetical protein